MWGFLTTERIFSVIFKKVHYSWHLAWSLLENYNHEQQTCVLLIAIFRVNHMQESTATKRFWCYFFILAWLWSNAELLVLLFLPLCWYNIWSTQMNINYSWNLCSTGIVQKGSSKGICDWSKELAELFFCHPNKKPANSQLWCDWKNLGVHTVNSGLDKWWMDNWKNC